MRPPMSRFQGGKLKSKPSYCDTSIEIDSSMSPSFVVSVELSAANFRLIHHNQRPTAPVSGILGQLRTIQQGKLQVAEVQCEIG